MKTVTIELNGIIIENMPLDRLTVQLQRQGLVVSLWHEVKAIPYQCCPKCNGQGMVSKPLYIAGDVHQWSATSAAFPCDVCDGKKIIPMHSLTSK